ncbi:MULTISPECIES: hypothetical protein [Cohnella]|uniref:ABC-type glycerol-3-phosphate transport system substrate-binding protein n=1 Tax=Cohnella phaseoli TaxID=456490 RepID=A0A3D9I8U1_9BACL|nr:hypothetical protein [Cohnella phaseoli]RED58194.1 ABC-type glycerol-3-phosphate transport system substrate-binding protein [Cohnella phaseoli]
MSNTKHRFTRFALASALSLSLLSACSNGGSNGAASLEASPSPIASTDSSPSAAAETPVKEELLEYTFLDTVHPTAPFGYNNPNDVVTPYVEDKFNIKVKDIIFSAGTSPVERINMLIAAGNLPDVVLADNPNLSVLYATGAFEDLTPYKDLLVNTDKFVSDTGWNMLMQDGKLIALPTNATPDQSNPDVKALTDADIHYRPHYAQNLFVREDILEKLGYKFKKVKELQAELDANPRRLTEADLAVEPAIDTPEKFEKLLYDIKALDLKENGKSVIPLELPDWGAYHLSQIYAPSGGYYANPTTQEVTGWINNPFMKEYYSHLYKWFSDGILDKDYLIQKPEQLQEKTASGRVAVTFFAPDFNAVRQNLAQLNPDYDMRPIAWPKSQYELETGNPSYIDADYPAGFTNILVKKGFKDIPRLLKYFDWFQSEEAMEITAWGPESAGLYEKVDGRRVFKDKELIASLDGTETGVGGKTAEYYGINNTSKAFLTAPATFYNNKTYHTEPTKFDAWGDLRVVAGASKLSLDGTVLPASGLKSNETSQYYWNTFRTTKTAQLIMSKNEDEFNQAWDKLVAEFNDKGGYEAGIEEMKPKFQVSLGVK